MFDDKKHYSVIYATRGCCKSTGQLRIQNKKYAKTRNGNNIQLKQRVCRYNLPLLPLHFLKHTRAVFPNFGDRNQTRVPAVTVVSSLPVDSGKQSSCILALSSFANCSNNLLSSSGYEAISRASLAKDG